MSEEEYICECGSKDFHFDRCIPMGYYCSKCGKSTEEPENQLKQGE